MTIVATPRQLESPRIAEATAALFREEVERMLEQELELTASTPPAASRAGLRLVAGPSLARPPL